MAVPKYPFPIVGGLERQAHELAKALVQRGHAVHALSSRFNPRQNDVDLIGGVRVHRVKWVEFKPARFLLFPFSLARILVKLRRDVDLVHVHNISWFGAFVTLFAKALGLPVITKLVNIGDFGIPGMRRRPFGFLRIALLKGCDAIIAMTPESVAELDGIGYPTARVLKVTNGIPLLPAASPQPRSSTTVNAIFVGRFSSQKGLLDLVHAWATVKARATRPVKLRLIGDGPQADELRALALALDLGETIEFFGYCGDVPAELAKVDLFVLPSYAEGNSNAILEAMRAGLPIVATRVGGASIQIGSEGERFLVAPCDRQALSDRLLELIEDETLRLRFGTAMRARIESMFAIDRVAATYEQAYDLILSGRRQQIGQLNPALFSRNKTEDIPCLYPRFSASLAVTMPSATEIVRATLTGSSVHDGWEAVYRTEANERACEMMFDRIAELVSPGKALDVGCGIGQHSIRLSRRGFDVTAGDFSPDRVEAARKNIARHGLSIPVRQEDVTNLSFPPATFDAVLCWGVLMHVPEVQKAIAELCRVVRAGGYIIVYENNARSVFSWFLDAGVAAKRLFGLSHVQRSERTSLGVESWVKPRDAGEYLIRRVFVGPFVREFEKHGATLKYRLPGQFSEAYRLSPKLAPAVHLFNSAWFRSGIPTLAMGNIFVFCR